jgi:aspartate/tyrosine/aromatic aminotransferase
LVSHQKINWNVRIHSIIIFNNFKIITKGLNSEQVKVVVDQYHIYLLSSGRISIAGLNDGNVAYVANAFHQATKNSNI